MKKVEIVEHGNYLYGNLDGVDFVSSGQLENGTKYGASVKLKFITKVQIVKNVSGIDIPTTKAVSQTIKIPTTDTELPKLVLKYNEFIGQDLLISYSTADNHTFTIDKDLNVMVVTDKGLENINDSKQQK